MQFAAEINRGENGGCPPGALPKAERHFTKLKDMGKKLLTLCLAAIMAVVATFAFNCDRAMAADRIILIYGNARETISFGDLERFVRSGTAPDVFRSRLNLNNDEVDALRKALEQEIPVSEEFLKKLLRSSIGQFVLTRLDPVVGLGTRANVEDLTEAFLNAVVDDKMSLLTIMKAYPTDEVSVNGPMLGDAYDKIKFVATDVLAVAEVVRNYMYDVVCTDEFFGSNTEYDVPEIISRSDRFNLAWPK
ncbi:MAG TPA: alpha/beta hydrolase [Oscillatoriaceae cyanobacterium M33_DOE_052]|uniref:Alpha/beta hydrolase n=1 Tax=Planktothricoides sp. SpSt-374 TaxID=2282167 RepID=A0A7C3ZJV1_9CYAN|nr:alpha/beta hydrolase [Oscillatoriaceae cyanobacterium M33_DOE_052]